MNAETEREQAGPTKARKSGIARLAAGLWSRRIVALVVIILGAGVWYVGVPLAFGPKVTVNVVRQAEFVQSVVASGHVQNPYRVNIGSQITGVVAQVPVDQGQTVLAGQSLIVLDDTVTQAQVVQAQGAVAQAEAQIRQIEELTLPAARESLKQAQATLDDAQATFDREARLVTSGFETKANLDVAKKVLDIARSQYESARLQVATNEPGGSQYVIAQTQLAQSRANLDAAQSRQNYTRITAPRDGLLISRNVEVGNVVQPAVVLMVLSPFAETELVVQLDEKNLGLLAVGQPALASADAYPAQVFEATVDYINPGVDIATASVEVKLKVPQPPVYLRQDMTVSVDIETARRPDALIVSAADVRGPINGARWVLKVENSRAVRQPVTLGLIGGGKAQIVSGLAAGDRIVPSTEKTIEAGDRLRAVIATEPGE
jgi:HlyD family secretion protein